MIHDGSVPKTVNQILNSEHYVSDTNDKDGIINKCLDQDILRIIRKQATTTTERYKTPKADTGILLNGVRTYSYRDTESIRFGVLEKISVNTQGRGYAKPPFVLVDQVPNKARAVLAGQVVESIIVDTDDIYPITPEITITSGRRAEVRAIVTGGKITSLQIDNPGEYYSSPPIVRIRDNAGRGRFATYNAIVSGDGEITGFEKIDEGNFYNQDTVIVDIIPVGEGATGTPELKEWNFNRYRTFNETVSNRNEIRRDVTEDWDNDFINGDTEYDTINLKVRKSLTLRSGLLTENEQIMLNQIRRSIKIQIQLDGVWTTVTTKPSTFLLTDESEYMREVSFEVFLPNTLVQEQ